MKDTFYIYMDKLNKGEITFIDFDNKVKSGEINMKGCYINKNMVFNHPKREIYFYVIYPKASIQRKVNSGEILTSEELDYLMSYM